VQAHPAKVILADLADQAGARTLTEVVEVAVLAVLVVQEFLPAFASLQDTAQDRIMQEMAEREPTARSQEHLPTMREVAVLVVQELPARLLLLVVMADSVVVGVVKHQERPIPEVVAVVVLAILQEKVVLV
jgi:secreted protein with Ig-like and vWFA domain